MADETIEHILHEMRFNPLSWCYPEGIPQSQHDNGELRKFADRIEAAWRRELQAHKKELETRNAVIQTEVAAREAEREAHKREIDAKDSVIQALSSELQQLQENRERGNSAALREALSAALDQVNKVYDILSKPCVVIEEARQCCREARGVLIPALSAPPRNCDLPNIDERFNEVCHKTKKCFDCKFGANNLGCVAAWLLDTADESEAAK